MKNKKSFVVKIAVSCFFFWLLLSFVRENELQLLLTGIQWEYFILSFLLIPVMLTTSCFKWKLLLDAQGKPVSFSALLRIYLIGSFFSNMLPSAVGGDVVRSFYSGQLIKNQAYAAVCVFLERFTGMLFLLFLVILAPMAKPELYKYPAIYLPVLGAITLLLIIFWIAHVKDPLYWPNRILSVTMQSGCAMAEKFSLPWLRKFIDFVERTAQKIISKLNRFNTELAKALRVIRSQRVLFLKLLLITAFFYFLTWINVLFSFRAFGVDVPFFAICSLVPTAMLVSNVPVTMLGNLGFIESVFVFYFLLVNIPVSESLAMMLLLRVKMLSLGLIGLFTYLMYKYYRRKDLEELQKFAGTDERFKK